MLVTLTRYWQRSAVFLAVSSTVHVSYEFDVQLWVSGIGKCTRIDKVINSITTNNLVTCTVFIKPDFHRPGSETEYNLIPTLLRSSKSSSSSLDLRFQPSDDLTALQISACVLSFSVIAIYMYLVAIIWSKARSQP